MGQARAQHHFIRVGLLLEALRRARVGTLDVELGDVHLQAETADSVGIASSFSSACTSAPVRALATSSAWSSAKCACKPTPSIGTLRDTTCTRGNVFATRQHRSIAEAEQRTSNSSLQTVADSSRAYALDWTMWYICSDFFPPAAATE
jgi:hypothetical protein